jgi:hypothetical protein
MAVTTTRPTFDFVEGAPRVVAGRRWRLDVPSRPPATEAEAVEVADLAWALVDSTDPGHEPYATTLTVWCDRITPMTDRTDVDLAAENQKLRALLAKLIFGARFTIEDGPRPALHVQRRPKWGCVLDDGEGDLLTEIHRRGM